MIGEHSTPAFRARPYCSRKAVFDSGPPVWGAAPAVPRLAPARWEVLCLLPGADNLGWLRPAAGKARIVVPGTAHDVGEKVRDFMDHGGAVRVGGRVTAPVIIMDREVAFLPGGSHVNLRWSVVTRNPSEVERLVSVFESHWKSARALADGLLMSDQQHEVITLLASGMTDDAVARKLDVSPRTVQRHVSRIMELLGVRSRLELGVRLTKRGVL